MVRLRATGPNGLSAESNPMLVTREGPRILWGDLHGHSNFSDGTGLPEDYYRYARDVAALDVAALTDHDHWGIPFLDAAPAALGGDPEADPQLLRARPLRHPGGIRVDELDLRSPARAALRHRTRASKLPRSRLRYPHRAVELASRRAGPDHRPSLGRRSHRHRLVDTAGSGAGADHGDRLGPREQRVSRQPRGDLLAGSRQLRSRCPRQGLSARLRR